MQSHILRVLQSVCSRQPRGPRARYPHTHAISAYVRGSVWPRIGIAMPSLKGEQRWALTTDRPVAHTLITLFCKIGIKLWAVLVKPVAQTRPSETGRPLCG